MMSISGAYSEVLSCDTPDGPQTFSAAFGPFRTPDGRVVALGTPEQYMGDQIEGSGGHGGQHGDDAAALIAKMLGANVLSDHETRNVLSIIRLAFQNRNVQERRPCNIAAESGGRTEDESLKNRSPIR